MQHAATHCNTLQLTIGFVCRRPHIIVSLFSTYISKKQWSDPETRSHIHRHCNTLQHAAMHCNTLQHTATHCNTLQHTATHCNTYSSAFFQRVHQKGNCQNPQTRSHIHRYRHVFTEISLHGPLRVALKVTSPCSYPQIRRHLFDYYDDYL